MRKRFSHYSLIFGLAALLPACQPTAPREGDLLFHVTPTANNITAVTPAQIDHVAICLGNDSVVEAIPGNGVVLSSIQSLRHQEGHYIIGRVSLADSRSSIANARRYIGCRYDSLFLPNDTAIYCSELVQLSYVTKKGDRLFEPIPMSFHDASGRVTKFWQQFYARRGMSVPEGWPGSNPAEMSQRKVVRILGRLR